MNEKFTYKVQQSVVSGKVELSGAKNSVLRLMAASLLVNDDIELRNYPSSLLDVKVHEDMLRVLGKEVVVEGKTALITEKKESNGELIWSGRSIRNTLLILGALTARYGYGKVPLPGGCKLGERKYDLHVMLLERLGATVSEEGDYLVAKASDGLVGTDIELPMRSTGATENSIICATLAKGKTVIWNPHIRPEILDLISFLNGCGASITCFGQERIEVTGVERLTGYKHDVIIDNMEALTWVVAAALTGGTLEIEKFPFSDLEVPLVYLRESGVRLFRYSDCAIVKKGNVYPLEISTGPYPGINSDMQPLLAVFGANSHGKSKVVDLRFPGRYGYAQELEKMGVKSKVVEGVLEISGGNNMEGALVNALDLRAGIALVLAGLVSSGKTVIENAWQIERGYDDFIHKANDVGIKIEKVYA